ncbi:MAG TPA: hypothetical protein VFI33_16865, partial [Puia sp.]|nr:hypothetical protein [Puia sp.]
HHQLFEHINNYNETMIRLNLYFLFSVMLLPISIQFLFTPNEPMRFQLLCYFFNLSFTIFTYGLLIRYIFSKKNNFSSIKDKQKIDKLKMNSLRQFSVFFIATILIALKFDLFYISFLIYPAQRIYMKVKNRLAKRKEPLQQN